MPRIRSLLKTVAHIKNSIFSILNGKTINCDLWSSIGPLRQYISCLYIIVKYVPHIPMAYFFSQ